MLDDSEGVKFASQGAVMQHQKITLSEASDMAFETLHQAEREREAASILEDYQNGDWKGVNDVIENMIEKQHRSGFDMREKALAAIDAQMESLKRKREIILADNAIWSAHFRQGTELLKPEHRDKLDLLWWWNERKENS